MNLNLICVQLAEWNTTNCDDLTVRDHRTLSQWCKSNSGQWAEKRLYYGQTLAEALRLAISDQKKSVLPDALHHLLAHVEFRVRKTTIKEGIGYELDCVTTTWVNAEKALAGLGSL